MKEYPFPMDRVSDATGWTIPLHAFLLALAIAPIIFLFVQSKRPAQTKDGVLLTIFTIILPWPLTALALSLPESMRAFVFGYLAFTEVLLVVALAITVVRLRKQQNASSLGCFLGAVILLGVGIGLCLPAVPSAREAARRMQCQNNLKQIILAMHNYESVYQLFPPGISANAGHRSSWRVEILRFSEWEDVYEDYNHMEAWDSQTNSEFAKLSLSIYTCPSNPFPNSDQGNVYTAYVRVHGPNTVLSRDKAVPLTGNSSSTIAIMEACGSNVVWTEPRDSLLDRERLGINLPGTAPNRSRAISSGYHSRGVNVAMLDGSLQFLSDTIDPAALQQLVNGTYVETAE